MAQRVSGYARQDFEFYSTPAWVIEALAEHVQLTGLSVWEPAAGDGAMAVALTACGASVRSTDVRPDEHPRQADRKASVDFLATTRTPDSTIEAIISNPPFGTGGRLAVQFIQHGLQFMRRPGSRVRLLAMLTAVDFDSASGRTDLFADCPEFAMKIALLRRIRWFDGPSGPSTNHCWMVWQRPDLAGAAVPRLRYAPRSAAASVLDTL